MSWWKLNLHDYYNPTTNPNGYHVRMRRFKIQSRLFASGFIGILSQKWSNCSVIKIYNYRNQGEEGEKEFFFF